VNRDRNRKPPEATIRSKWLSVKQAAQYMGCTLNYVRRLCQHRRIPFAKVGHRYVLDRKDLDAHVESRKQPVLSASVKSPEC